MSSIKDMIDVDTIIGEPISTGIDTLIIPISKVAFGFAAGGSEFKGETINEYSKKEKEEQVQYRLPFGGGSGAGGSIEPVAFLVVSNGVVKLLPISHDSSIDINRSFNYDYTIYAKLSASYKESNGVETEIWDKMYPLKWQEQSKTKQGKLSINEQISVPYQDYQNIVNDFRQSFGLNVDAKLDIIMEIHQVYGENDSKTSKSLLSVPMNQDVVQITTEYDKNDTFVKQENVSNLRMNSTITIILLILLGVGFGFLIFAIILKLLPSHSKSKYEMMKNKIKKDYGSIIIDVDNHINFSKFTIFDIKTIEELVDLEEEVRIPILFYEKKKNKVCYFVIIKDNYMYRFTLEDLDVEIL